MSIVKPQGTHYFPLPAEDDIGWILQKKDSSIVLRHLITLFAPLSPASFCSLCNFIFPFLCTTLFVSPGPALSRRESSISRMKALSPFGCVRKVMTAADHRLLSRAGCSSFHPRPLIIMSLVWCQVFFSSSTLGAGQIPVFHTVFKKNITPQRQS